MRSKRAGDPGRERPPPAPQNFAAFFMDSDASTEGVQIRIVQLQQNGQLRVARVRDADTLQILAIQGGSYTLAQRAVEEKRSLAEVIDSIGATGQISYQRIIDEGALLPPVPHP